MTITATADPSPRMPAIAKRVSDVEGRQNRQDPDGPLALPVKNSVIIGAFASFDVSVGSSQLSSIV